ncbi:regulator of DNA class I crossover intermediates 1 isoform X2 [Danio rerio]|uniref:Regulator of DNA class I crossover intermediates 1 isoform X2 n=1 Tax=Danio rerio TaxID=7955 RepID=A0AB32TUA9_DANRE
MNWVGGSRSRCIKNKDDTARLRAFFQKQKMKRHTTPDLRKTQEQSTGNVDLLSLFIANQLASKKEPTNKPIINRWNGPNETKQVWRNPSQFPQSSCPASGPKLSLVTNQKPKSVSRPGFKLRKHRLSKYFQSKLSPLIESNMSDGSGSDNQHQPSSSSAASKAPIQPHVPFTLQSTANSGNRTFTPQPLPHSSTKPNNPWLHMDSQQNVLQNSPAIRFQFESPLPNREMGETSDFFPLSCLKSSEDTDNEVFSSFTSCDRSEKMENSGFFSMQKEEHLFIRQSSHSFLVHSEETLRTGNTYLPVKNKTPAPSPAPSCRQVAKSTRHCQTQTRAPRHEEKTRTTLDKETQTAASFYRDVSVQCSLLPDRSTRRQSFPQLLGHVTLHSPKEGHRRTRSRPSGHSKSQPDLSFRSLRRQRSAKRDLTSAVEGSGPKSSDKEAAMGMQNQTAQV